MKPMLCKKLAALVSKPNFGALAQLKQDVQRPGKCLPSRSPPDILPAAFDTALMRARLEQDF